MTKTPWMRRMAAVTLSVLLAASVLGLAGCAPEAAEQGAAPAEQAAGEPLFPVTVTDDADREVTIDAPPERIVSLAPANTEIVYALGLLDRLVGVTTFDDYPEEVLDLPKMGDFITPNLEEIAAAEADLVLVTTGVQADLIEQLEAAGATVIAVDPQDVDGLVVAIEMVGAVTGVPEAAAEVVAELRAGIEAVQAVVAGADPVTCFVEIAQEPLFTVGEDTLIDELIVLAGGVNVVSEAGYVGYSVEQLLQDDPEVYLATAGSMSDPSMLETRPGYDALTAVAEGRIAILTDNLVSRPGPRIVEGLKEIARALHPDAFGDES